MVKTIVSVFNTELSSLRGLIKSHLRTVRENCGKEFHFNEHNDDLHGVIVNAVEYHAGKEEETCCGLVIVNISASIDRDTKSIQHQFHIVSDVKNVVEIIEYC